MNMGVFPSGQWGQTVNLLLSASVVRIHPRPPKNLNVRKYAEVFVLLQSQTHRAGGFKQQRSRPPPAAETGRRGWGSAPLFQSPAKGLWKKRQAQLVRPAEQPGATATTAASGRSREELLGLRPAGCACRPRHDAAAGSRDPGSFLFRAARVIHPRPPKNLNV